MTTSYRIGNSCQMCCCSAKQSLQAEAVPACCHIFCPVRPQGQIQAAQFRKSIFAAKRIYSEQKPHLRNLNMQAAYEIHAGFLQHIEEIFKLSNVLSPGTLEFLEMWATCCSLCCSPPNPGSRTLSDPLSHVSSKVAVLCQGTSAVLTSLWQRFIQLQIGHKVCLTLPIHS